MGNILRCCCGEEDDGGDYYPYRYPASRPHYRYDQTAVPVLASRPQKQQPPRPHGVAALQHDLLNFEATFTVPASQPQKQQPPPPRPHGIAALQHDLLKFEAISTVTASRPQKQHPPPPCPPHSHGVATLQHDLLKFEATSTVPASQPQNQQPPPRPHGIAALQHDILKFEATSTVPASQPQKQQPPPPPRPHGIAALQHDLLKFEATSTVTASRPQKQHPPPPRPHGVTTLQHDLLKFEATSTVTASRPQKQQPPPPRPHGVAALQNDLLYFVATSAVPEGLAEHVESSKKEQVEWYRNMLEAYKDKKPRPKTSEEAAMLVARALNKIQRANLEGVLTFYGLPIPALPAATSENHLSSLPEGVQFVMKTLPVDARGIVDGDGFTAYVDTVDPRESENVPLEVREAVTSRAQARSSRNYKKANALQNIVHEAGYKIMVTSGGEILARKYRIRIRGIDAPEMEMKYGKKSQYELVKLIARKSVTIYAYGQDQFGRYVGDIYCDDVFIQEQMLKKGHAWHFKNYDKRPEFAEWEKEAQAARRGLWASDNPEKPWEWRKNKRNTALRSSGDGEGTSAMRDIRTSPFRCPNGHESRVVSS